MDHFQCHLGYLRVSKGR